MSSKAWLTRSTLAYRHWLYLFLWKMLQDLQMKSTFRALTWLPQFVQSKQSILPWKLNFKDLSLPQDFCTFSQCLCKWATVPIIHLQTYGNTSIGPLSAFGLWLNRIAAQCPLPWEAEFCSCRPPVTMKSPLTSENHKIQSNVFTVRKVYRNSPRFEICSTFFYYPAKNLLHFRYSKNFTPSNIPRMSIQTSPSAPRISCISYSLNLDTEGNIGSSHLTFRIVNVL